MKTLKILKVCATETATYFGGESVLVPNDVDEALAEQWVADGIAEELGEPERDSPKAPEKPAKKKAKTE